MEDKTRTTIVDQALVTPTVKDEPHESQVVQRASINTQPKKGDGAGDSDSESTEQGMMKRKASEMSLVSSNSISDQCEKRGRGRPRGSGKLQLLASLGGIAAKTAGGAFTPYVLIVQPGEDVVKKLLSFSQIVSRPVCILSANGVVSSVILCHSDSSGGKLKYEGLFEILTLCGPYNFGDIWNVPQKSSLLRITLAKPNGGVFGGVVAGPVMVAGSVQIIVGSFKQNIMREFRMRNMTESSASSSMLVNSDINCLLAKDIPNDDEHCTTPTSALSESTKEEAGDTATANQAASDDSQEVDGQGAMQSPQLISGEGLSPVVNFDSPRM